MILTPEQIAEANKIWQTWWVGYETISDEDIYDTLAAYADIVDKIAEDPYDPELAWVLGTDLYHAARKLRQKED